MEKLLLIFLFIPVLTFGQLSNQDEVSWDKFIDGSTDFELLEFDFKNLIYESNKYQRIQDSLSNGTIVLSEFELMSLSDSKDRVERKKRANYLLTYVNIDPKYIDRGNIFQKFLRSVVIVGSMVFTNISYRNADKMCVSFCPSYDNEMTNSYVLEAMQEIHFDFIKYYRRVFTDQQLENIFGGFMVLTQFDRKLQSEFNYQSWLRVGTVVKFTPYLLGFITLVIALLIFRRKLNNKLTSNPN